MWVKQTYKQHVVIISNEDIYLLFTFQIIEMLIDHKKKQIVRL